MSVFSCLLHSVNWKQKGQNSHIICKKSNSAIQSKTGHLFIYFIFKINKFTQGKHRM